MGGGDTKSGTGSGTDSGHVEVDGVSIPVTTDQTLAAAMWAAGIRSWRTTRVQGRPRGIFCGIGACYDCLVEVNGTADVRACITPARPGDVIRRG